MASPSNLNLAIIPFENPESLSDLLVVMFIDSYRITHLAYPLMEKSLVCDLGEETTAYSEGEPISSKERVHPSYDDDDDSPIVQLIPKRLRSRLKSPISDTSEHIPVRVTHSVQRTRDAVILARSTTKARLVKRKFVPPFKPIEIDNDIVESKKSRKRKRNVSKTKDFGHIKNGDSDLEIEIEKHRDWINSFKKKSVICDRVITGLGGNEMGELFILLKAQGWTALFLQGNRRRKIARKETMEFYINVVRSVSSISSSVGGISFTLTTEVLEKILSVPNSVWCHYVKHSWPPLEGLSSVLEISRRVDKGAMLPLHKLLFDVVHKIILPRKQKQTEANYLDLTLMELLISQVLINLPQLICSHINRICVDDSTDHGLGYGFWLGDIFEYFQDVLGEVDHAAIPMTSRGENAPMQRLRASLTAKNEEIAALQVSHSVVIDQLHIDYGIKHVGLVGENSRLKEELAQTHAALNAERSSNSDNLKHLFELLTKGSPLSSSTMPPSV
ncbi:hypothetical protein R3W88_016592 [Solanum pinnatisectum]|uniref:Uncharacterized protein n=1 Tax=Solanum pinnatisectum TaxID=50273 RepID=A0AAV9KY13_9SOLN|nr:hypothetical protein R3W88_016592 [Solanum pinnatisectum]